MKIKTLMLVTTIVAGFAFTAKAQNRWSGVYGGLSFTSSRLSGSLGSNATHKYSGKSGLLGIYGGINFSNGIGFVWGPELALTGINPTGSKTDAALGTSNFVGSYLLSTKLRGGWATDNAFFYGIGGVNISNASINPAGSSGKKRRLGVSYGIGAEFALGDQWSTRIELMENRLGGQTQSFNGSSQKSSIKNRTISLGITRRF